MQRRMFSSAALCGLASGALAAPLAHAARPPSLQALGHWARLSVIDRDTGQALTVYRHQGEFWVVGTPGTHYAIRVHNLQAQRLMAVMSVDGVNVLTGESAGQLQNGYVFGPGELADIAGWRKSDAEIAAFEFTALSDSYASRTGRPRDVGVMGLALFRERLPEPVTPPALAPAPQAAREADGTANADAAAEPAASARARGEAKLSATRPAPAPRVGTGHGRREHSPVSRTTFERASRSPDEVLRTRYDSRERLIAAGIVPRPRHDPWPRGPSAFPADTLGYVPDPPPRR